MITRRRCVFLIPLDRADIHIWMDIWRRFCPNFPGDTRPSLAATFAKITHIPTELAPGEVSQNLDVGENSSAGILHRCCFCGYLFSSSRPMARGSAIRKHPPRVCLLGRRNAPVGGQWVFISVVFEVPSGAVGLSWGGRGSSAARLSAGCISQ